MAYVPLLGPVLGEAVLSELAAFMALARGEGADSMALADLTWIGG